CAVYESEWARQQYRPGWFRLCNRRPRPPYHANCLEIPLLRCWEPKGGQGLIRRIRLNVAQVWSDGPPLYFADAGRTGGLHGPGQVERQSCGRIAGLGFVRFKLCYVSWG